MDDWQRVLWDRSVTLQAIELNPKAALQAAIFAAGFVPVESEFWYTVGGTQYAAQAAEHLGTGERRVYYAVVPNWSAVSWFGYEPAQYTILDITDQLTHHPSKQYESRSLSAITDLVVHHTVSPLDTETNVIAQFHVFSRDWPGIGYHYVVDHSGLIEQVNRLETISYHASGANSYSVGIALKGDFSDFSPGQIQLDAVHWLVTYLRGRLAIQHVLGHREAAGAATECPGDTWGSWKSKVV